MKYHFLLVIFGLLATISVGFSDSIVLPYFGGGFGYNTNLDLVPTASTSALYLRKTMGIGFAGYLNPDIQSMVNVIYRTDSYQENDYGIIQTLGAAGHLLVDVTEQLNIGASLEWLRTVDSAVIINNSTVFTFTPILNYKFSSDIESEYFYSLNYSQYPNTSENISESIYGINLLVDLPNEIKFGCTGRAFTAKNDIPSYNYQGYAFNSKLSIFLTSNIEINLEYGIQQYIYSNWNNGRSDVRNIYTFRLTKGFPFNTELSLYVSKINNNSTQTDQNYENSTGTIVFTWYPEFGRMFAEENASEYYFNAGIIACEQSNWVDAEKQFRKALFNDTKTADRLFYLGYSLHKQNRSLEASIEFENAINNDPLFYEAYSLLLLDYHITHQVNKIEKLFAKIKILAMSDERFLQLTKIIEF